MSYRYIRGGAQAIFWVCCLLWSMTAWATHNRAGEITYEQTGPLSIRATITTYTRTSSVAADRDSLELFWGDGTSTIVGRSNGNGEELPNDIKVNYYTAEHTYPTRSQYVLSVLDPNRIAGIQNINFSNSVNIRFYIQTTLTLIDQRFEGFNSSAILLQPPIDFGCVGEVFVHNPNAYDPDGDSLAFELITPFAGPGMEVPNYVTPDQIAPGDSNQISLNPMTGEFIWRSPQLQGDYNITYLIKEYRNGILINQIIRDMQVLVTQCLLPDSRESNSPPRIIGPEEICVIAGETIDIDYFVSDPDSLQVVTVTALGGPLLDLEMPARVELIDTTETNDQIAKLIWETQCSHISDAIYQVVIKATDDARTPNLGDGGTGLATLKTITIKVTGPPPSGVLVEKAGPTSTRITWDGNYPCVNDANFQGFSVWRNMRPTTIPIDTCQGGLNGTSYQEIIFLTAERGDDGRFFAIDSTLNPNNTTLCYRVLGEYAQTTALGNPYNASESIRSEEACVLFDRTAPIITEVNVLTTDDNNGQLRLSWLPPIPDEIDTMGQLFTIRILQSNSLDGQNMVENESARRNFTSFAALQEYTSVVLAGLNTRQSGYSYIVEWSIDNRVIASSELASSIFLTANAADQSANLSWDFQVPWQNYAFEVINNTSGDTLLTTDNSIRVENLANGKNYCFIVKGYGSYGVPELDSMLNFSQEACVTPNDNEAPCSPSFQVQTICEEELIDPEELVSTVFWTFDMECPIAPDFDQVNIYFRPVDGDDFELIGSQSASDDQFMHVLDDQIAGCYALTAVDVAGNESELSPTTCVDNCPAYLLPNSFTPNNDGFNDIFQPRINRFVERIEMSIYNRWGQLVYETTDPAINWDGTIHGEGSPLDNGSYYYVCHVYESRVDGVVPSEDILTGYIQLIRSLD